MIVSIFAGCTRCSTGEILIDVIVESSRRLTFNRRSDKRVVLRGAKYTLRGNNARWI